MATNMSAWTFTNFSTVHNYLLKHFSLIYWFILRQPSCLGIFVYIFIKTCICVSFVFTVDPEYQNWQQKFDLIIFLRFLFCLFFFFICMWKSSLRARLVFLFKNILKQTKPDLEPLFKESLLIFLLGLSKKTKKTWPITSKRDFKREFSFIFVCWNKTSPLSSFCVMLMNGIIRSLRLLLKEHWTISPFLLPLSGRPRRLCTFLLVLAVDLKYTTAKTWRAAEGVANLSDYP